jgi:cytochrome c553
VTAISVPQAIHPPTGELAGRAHAGSGAFQHTERNQALQTNVCGFCHDRSMSKSEPVPIAITLSPTQIDEVVRAASRSRAPSISTVIGGYLPSDLDDPRLSQSLVRGLSLLTCFGSDGAARGIVELALDAGMSPSTAHRYASTLVELGLLERDPKSRKYRLPSV